ncbi:MAG: hypothetical protein RR315_07185 [Oscillospiraceae bacterium]
MAGAFDAGGHWGRRKRKTVFMAADGRRGDYPTGGGLEGLAGVGEGDPWGRRQRKTVFMAVKI